MEKIEDILSHFNLNNGMILFENKDGFFKGHISKIIYFDENKKNISLQEISFINKLMGNYYYEIKMFPYNNVFFHDTFLFTGKNYMTYKVGDFIQIEICNGISHVKEPSTNSKLIMINKLITNINNDINNDIYSKWLKDDLISESPNLRISESLNL